MRYAAVYRPGTVQIVAFVHVSDAGTVELARPIAKDVAVNISVDGLNRRRITTPAFHDTGYGPDGRTYHA